MQESTKNIFDELVEYVADYESDTFSASGEELTKEEAVKIATTLVENNIQNMLDGMRLDGVMISSILEDLRPEAEEEE